MRDFFSRLRYKTSVFMRGRYGGDQFSRFLSFALIVLIVLNFFLRRRILGLLAWAVLIYMYFRIFSKNIPRRYAENQKYLQVRARVLGLFGRSGGSGRSFKEEAEYRKAYKIFKCPSCGQKIRIPRGKGQIMISCPKCRTEFEKRS